MTEGVWLGESRFQILSFLFRVRWNSKTLWDGLSPLMEQFHTAWLPGEGDEDTPAFYSLEEVSPPESLRYRVLFGDTLVSGSDLPGPVLDVLLWHINSETVRQTRDFLLIHAAAAATPAGEGVLLPAPSGAGKSTLVTGLVRGGFLYLSDEAGAINPVTRKLYPYPKAISLSANVVATLFPELEDGSDRLTYQRYIQPERLRPGATSGPCPVRFVILHRYEEGSPTSLSQISRGTAALELGRNTMNHFVYGKQALSVLSDLALGASCYRMTYGNLQEAVETVQRLTSSGAESPNQAEKTPSSLDAKSPW